MALCMTTFVHYGALCSLRVLVLGAPDGGLSGRTGSGQSSGGSWWLCEKCLKSCVLTAQEHCLQMSRTLGVKCERGPTLSRHPLLVRFPILHQGEAVSSAAPCRAQLFLVKVDLNVQLQWSKHWPFQRRGHSDFHLGCFRLFSDQIPILSSDQLAETR